MSDDTYEVPNDAHVEYLSTLATCRFDITGEAADDALELHIEDCLGKLMGAINRLVSAHLMLSDERHPILSPVYDQNSLDHLYVLIEGRNADATGAQRISPNAFRSALYVPEYDEEQSEPMWSAVKPGSLVPDEVSGVRIRSRKPLGTRRLYLWPLE